MPTPKEVFDNPLQYLDLLQSADFETSYRDTLVTLYNRDNLLADRSIPRAAYTTTSKPETPPEQGSAKKALRSIGERLAKIQ